MAQQKQPDDTNTANQKPSDQQQVDTNASTTPPTHQQPTPDWKKVGNMIASAIINASDSAAPSQKPKRDILAIYNAVVVTLAFLGTLFLGTYGAYYVNSKLNEQNNQLQKQLIRFQQNLDSANIQLVKLTSSSFSILNKGEASAKDLTITVSMIYVFNNWMKDAQNIRTFIIKPSDNSLLGTTSYSSDNKVVKIELTQLPVGEIFTTTFYLPTSMLSAAYNYSTPTSVYFNSSNLPARYNNSKNNVGADALFAAFDDLFGVAGFEINLTCSNCTSFPGVILRYSTASTILSPLRQLTLDRVSQEDFITSTTYQLPKGMNPISLKSPLYLDVGFVLATNLDPSQQFSFLHANAHDIQTGFYAWPDFILRACMPSDCPFKVMNG